MSAYAARLKNEMRPMLDELKELNELDEPTDEQKSDIDRIAATLAQKKSEHDKALERHQKMLGAETMFDGLTEPTPQPRAVYEKSSNGKAAEPEYKALADYLIDSREFKNPRNGHYNVVEPVPPAVPAAASARSKLSRTGMRSRRSDSLANLT